MANPVTLADLRARALDYADMTGSTFPVTARVTDYVNDGLSALHDILIESYEDYLYKTGTVSVVSGTESYNLPTDFYKLLKCFYLSSNRRYTVKRFSLSDIDGYKSSPISSGTFELWYIPQFAVLSGDSDTVHVSVPIRWENFVALHAAIQLLNREESDSSALMREREAERARIISMAQPRDIGEQMTVEDHSGRWNGSRHFLAADEKSFMYRIMGDKIIFTQSELVGV
jgi:hypothetical protein